MAITETSRPSGSLLTNAGLAVFTLAYGRLVATGNSEIVRSSDPGAAGMSLWAAALPPLAAIVLARLVPPATAPPLPLAGLPRERVSKEARTLVAAALVLACVAPFAQDAYPLVKLLLLLLLPLMAFVRPPHHRDGPPRQRAAPTTVIHCSGGRWAAPRLGCT